MTASLPTWAFTALVAGVAALIAFGAWKTRGKTDDITDLEDRI